MWRVAGPRDGIRTLDLGLILTMFTRSAQCAVRNSMPPPHTTCAMSAVHGPLCIVDCILIGVAIRCGSPRDCAVTVLWLCCAVNCAVL